MSKVTLSSVELMHVAVAGIMRRVSALNKSRGAQHGITPDREWQADIEGLAGEYVLAKHLGKFWQPVVGRLDTDEGDVHGLQVRTTAWKNGCLIVNKKDPDDDPFVLVTGDNSVGFNWYIRGWMYGRDAKKDEWWKAKQKDRYAYFVEQKHLRPMHELIDLSDKGGHNVHTP